MAKQQTVKTNPLEVVAEMGQVVKDQGVDLLRGVGSEAAAQLGLKARTGGSPTEMVMGKQAQTLELKVQKAEQKVQKLEAKFHSTVIQNSQEVYNFEKQKEQQQIKQILTNLAVEVKNIQAQAASLSGDVAKVTVEQMPSADKYHVNFFEWVLTMLQDIKKDIVKSRTWLQAFNSKKKKKGYWGMFKKHGMSFAMSDERAIATAAG